MADDMMATGLATALKVLGGFMNDLGRIATTLDRIDEDLIRIAEALEAQLEPEQPAEEVE